MPNLYVFTAGSRSSKLIRFYAYRTQKLIHHAKFRAARYRTQSGACDAHADARGEGVTGNKAWLRRRLHAAIVCEHLVAAAADAYALERERTQKISCACGAPTYTLIRFYGNLVHVHTYSLLRPKAQTYTQPPPYGWHWRAADVARWDRLRCSLALALGAAPQKAIGIKFNLCNPSYIICE